jgi:rRNA maturation RNase YbeY
MTSRVTIYSRLRLQPLPSLTSLQTLAYTIKDVSGYPRHDLGITLVSPRKISIMNKMYRKKQGATDVLSFSAKSLSTNHVGLENDLGDLFVCPQVIAKDATTEQISLELQWRRILIHGVIHLAGFDHETDEDFKKMNDSEILVLKTLNELEESGKRQLRLFC